MISDAADGRPLHPSAPRATTETASARGRLAVALRDDRLWQAGAALGVALSVIHYTLSSGPTRRLFDHAANLAMLAAVGVTLATRWTAQPRLTRRFWQLWAIGLASWAGVALFDLLAALIGLRRPLDPALSLARTLGYTGIYLAAILALELRPHAAAERTAERLRWLEGLASALTALALFVYLVVLPAHLSSPLWRTNVPASVLYLCLDGVLLWRLALCVLDSQGAWRAVYGCLTGVVGLWAASDGAEAMRWAGLIGETRFLLLADVVWLPQFVGLALAARVAPLAPGVARTRPSEEPRGTALLAQTLLLPAFHALVLATGGWEPAQHPASSVWMLAVLLALGGLAVFYMRGVEDVTRTQARALNRAYAELSASVDAMRTARDQAEAANQAKSRLLAIMSHEIRTPMNGVLGTASLVLRSNLSEAQRQLMETIQSSGRALLAILDDVLDLSRLEVGRLQLQLETFDVAATLEDVVASLAELAHDKGLELALITDGLRRSLRGDSARFRQILVNLIGNAIKFTDRGQVAVHARALAEDDEGVELLIEVADTGVGIAPEAAERLFKPFSQAAGGFVRGGSGLGLLISRQLATLMGGDIQFESQPNRGSVFRVTVRLPRPLAPDTAPTATPAPPVRRILVVEPRPLTRFALQRLCAELGVPTQATGDAPGALRAVLGAAHGDPFDVLLIATEILEADQGALLDRLRRDPRLAATRVIAVGDRVLDTPAGDAAPRLPLLPTPVRLRSLSQALSADAWPSAAPPRLQTPAAVRGRALVVDDNSINQAVAEGMLVLLGFEVVLASNGVEALARMASEHFDVVLMDYMMPDMDGLQVTVELRRREQAVGGRRTPVVALTAVAMAGDRERCLAAGMDDYIAKPVGIEQLEQVLARIVPHRPGHPPNTPSSGGIRSLRAR